MSSNNDKSRKKSNGGENQQQQEQEREPKRLKTKDSSMAIITETGGGGGNDGVNNKRQTQLGNFFTTKKKKNKTKEEKPLPPPPPPPSSSSPSAASSLQKDDNNNDTTNMTMADDNNKDDNDPMTITTTTLSSAATAAAATTTTEATMKGCNDEKKMNAALPAEPLVPTLIDSSKLTYRPIWESHYDSHVIIRRIANKNKNKNKTQKKRKLTSDNQNIHESCDESTITNNNNNTMIKVAAFDIDGTLVNWTTPPGQWPSQLNHYELWSSNVVTKIRELSDLDYQILLVSNQGGIQKAHTGKKATKIKQIVDWIGHIVDRPIEAVMSTRTIKKCPKTSYHKPTSKLWDVAEKLLFKTTASNGGGGSSSSSSNTKNHNFFAAASTKKSTTSSNPPRRKIDLSQSFFVGDSADPDDDQGGVDMKFALNCGIKFFTPEQYFGISDQERRQQLAGISGGGNGSGIVQPPPVLALQARSALFGGYLQGPIMLILCGVQGSGKSTFCQRIIGNNKKNKKNWAVLSQDTINKGKPGPRTKVEKEATRLLKEEKMSVIIDRMHLTPDQRKYFYDVALHCQVPAHVVLLNPPKSIVTQRVKSRTDHPGGVQGSQGVKLVLQSLNSLILPTYDEFINDDNKKNDDNDNNNNNTTYTPHLISCTSTNIGAARLADLYRSVVHDTTTASITVTGSDDNDYKTKQQQQQEHDIVLREGNDKKFGNGMGNGDDGNNIIDGSNNMKNDNTLKMPIITLGTMGIGKRITKDVLTMAYNIGCRSIDTAPTYKNEDRVGEVLQDLNNGHGSDEKTNRMFCIVKVPKKVTKPDEVRTELLSSLQKLQLEGKGCDLLLLHWPCDVIGMGTLEDVWKEMESCMKDGLCRGLGVCNFNASALSQLLSCCTVRPVINQVERHPLLPQWDLIDYCSRYDIIVQAHTPLGHANDALLDHPTITEVAKDTSLTPSQVVLQWNIQHGLPVVPKFSSEEHGREIYQLLENSNNLSSTAMKKLNGIVLAPVEGGGGGGKQGKKNNKTKRFVAPPFMYGKSSYCWGERPPPRETTKKSK